MAKYFTDSKNDEYYTPAYAVEPILEFLKGGATVWCPFDTDESNYVKVFKKNGFKVINGHISTGQDFFKVEAPICDYVISNPPYTAKHEVLKRLNKIGIPYAMLLNPISPLDSRKGFKEFQDGDFELLYLYPRIRFIIPNTMDSREKTLPWGSTYFCRHLLPKQIICRYLTMIQDGQGTIEGF